MRHRVLPLWCGVAVMAGSAGARAQGGVSARAGWVGVALLASGQSDGRSGAVAMRYPVIASVEPGSPAQHAGLAAGDTILSFNGVDARDPTAIGRFLIPGGRIVFHLRRNGVRDVALRVAERPAGEDDPRLHVTMRANGIPGADFAPLAAALGPLALAHPLAASRALPLAGAQLARLNRGLAQVLRVRDAGVLVVDVAPGTAAHQAGLQPGDIIVRADSLDVTSPLAMLRAIQDASDRRVVLSVMRLGRTQHITLRW